MRVTNKSMSNEKREVNNNPNENPDDIEALEEINEELDNKEVIEEKPKESKEVHEETKEEVIAPETSPGEETGMSQDEVEKYTKKVQGETSVERAMRAEITRLKKERRETQQKNLIEDEEKPVDNKDIDQLKELGYDEEEIPKLQKAVDIMAARGGYVKKGENYQNMANETLDDFIESHTEYSPDNDKDDIRWSRFQTILKSDYNLKGKSSTQLKGIFNKVDRDIKEELGEVIVDSKKNKRLANKEKIESVSPGTSTSSKSPELESKTKAIPAGNKTYIVGGHTLKGFDDEDIEDLTK